MKKSEIFLDKYCQKIINLKENHFAVEYLENRKIPKEKWNDIYFIDNFSNLKPEFEKYNILPNDSRIIIPIRNRSGNIIGITGRAIKFSKLRYIILKKTEEPLLFNRNLVNLNEKIYVTEGAFDSMFLKNAIAVDGADFSKILDLAPKNNFVIIFDNQPRNNEIIQRMKKICDEGFSMVIWPRDLANKGKDINALIEAGMPMKDIQTIIDDNTYSGLKCKLKLADWRIN